MQIAAGRAELESKSAESADLTVDAALKILAAPRPRKFPTPDLESDKNFVADDTAGDIALIVPSVRHPGYHYLIRVGLTTGEVMETMMPVNLKAPTLESWLQCLKFDQAGEWRASSREKWAVLLLDERTKTAAWNLMQCVTRLSWPEAIAAATSGQRTQQLRDQRSAS